MTTRSILGLAYTVNSLKSLGYLPQPVLERHGIKLETLDPFAEIERSLELQILSELFAPVASPHIGLEMGIRIGLAGYGPFTMLLMSCQNAYEACRAGVRYQSVGYSYGEIRLDTGTEVTALCLQPAALPNALNRIIIDRDVSGTYRLIKDILLNIEQEVSLAEVWFSYPKPDDVNPYEAMFQCEVKFDQPYCRIAIKNTELSTPFPNANQTAYDYYRAQCDQVIAKRTESIEHLSGKVRKHLELFAYELPSIVDVAEAFGLAERTLRRQLKNEETSYQKILDSVRFDKAKQLLQTTNLPIDEVASRLGYQEAASFNHAFQRWSGTTPSKFRKNT
ncbi:AraC family transcriptional regulator [Alkalimarinus alittae]|uniref:AraC family transcriptional regulator n=1 Tax=Alkalimarinus alittae TaxID=2961619 RepID=A0ABY6N2K8_9ALTE|nr:AraC family transcriptional regulator [Alkalimarinus alittae]UZE96316.1 AraC family transcriptional regulator [Alkalimarinus alittae]